MIQFSKLKWQRQLRGHPISPTEYRVLLAVFVYTDRDGEHAYPGWERLVADTRLDMRTVKAAVRRLVDRGYLMQTREGGGRGRANEYALGDLEQVVGPLRPVRAITKTVGTATGSRRRQSTNELNAERNRQIGLLEKVIAGEKGGHPMPPFAGEDDASAVEERGASGAERGTSDVEKGGQPMPPHQVVSDLKIIPPTSGGASSDAPRTDWQLLHEDFDALTDWLNDELGRDNWDYSAALGMWEGRAHPKTIRNWMIAQGWGKQSRRPELADGTGT